MIDPFSRRFQPKASDPATAPDGTVWYNSTSDVFKGVANGSTITFNTSGLSGSGTANKVVKFTDSATLGNSIITDNGTNVGIGTSSPLALGDTNLTVSNTGASKAAAIEIQGNSGSSTFALLDFYNNTNRAISIEGVYDGATNTSRLELYTSNAGAVNVQAMVVKGNGNVGIGTPSPGEKLTIAGNVSASGVLLMTGQQVLTGAGAVNLTTDTTLLVTTGADALTLADGSEGQVKTIVMNSDGGDGTLTPAHLAGATTIVFDDVGDTVTLKFLSGKWYVVGSFGVTIS